MYGTDNTIKVLIGKNIPITASASLDPHSANYVADGEISILTENATTDVGEEVNPGTAKDRQYIRFTQRSGDTIHYSPRIKVANITKTKLAASVAAKDQVDYIGYNTTSGSIEELNNNQYLLHITYRHDDKIWSEQLNKRTYCYYSDLTANQSEIASNFVKQINMDLYTSVSAVIVNDSIGAALTSTGQDVIVNNGSNLITFAADVSATVSAGSYLKIGGTATTTPVYKVKSIAAGGLLVTLDTTYQGTSATVASANVNVCNAIIYVGISLTGLAITYKPKGIAPYNRTKFDTAIANFGSTVITNATAMTWGNGLYEQVADLEWFALGGDGIRNFMWHPIPTGRTDAVSGQFYYMVTIEYYNNDDQYVISGSKPAKALVYLFFAAGTSAAVPPSNTNYSAFISNFNLYVPANLEI
jgi:hypothetical protein